MSNQPMSILNFGILVPQAMAQQTLVDPIVETTQIFETPRLRRNRLARERRRRLRDQAAAPYPIVPEESKRDRRNRLARERYAQKKRNAAIASAIQRTRTVLKTRMSSRPFVLNQSFGGVWSVYEATPFEDQRRYPISKIRRRSRLVTISLVAKLVQMATFRIVVRVEIFISFIADARQLLTLFVEHIQFSCVSW